MADYPTTLTTKNNLKPMPKSVHRQIEVSATCGKVYSHSVGCCNCLHERLEIDDAEEDEDLYVKVHLPPCKYSRPKLNTVLRRVQEIEDIQLKNQKALKKKSVDDLTPRSKAIIAPKITKKLNFRPDQIVFKNLIPINVNDSILLPQKPPSIRKKYVKSSKKMVAPDLKDFLDPLPPLIHHTPEPEISIEFTSTDFDYFGSYLRLYD